MCLQELYIRLIKSIGSVYNYLYQYFILNKNLFLPSIGRFTIESGKASLNFIDKQIPPPVPVINFEEDGIAENNNLLRFLSYNMQVAEEHVEKMFKNFAAALQSELNVSNIITLPGIGTITKDAGNTSFSEKTDINTYFPVITIEPVIRKDADHKIMVGDAEKSSVIMQQQLAVPVLAKRWWIPAAVLAVIGFAALIFYYASH